MKRALWAVPLLMIVCAEFALATYNYYYTENGANPNWSNWTIEMRPGTGQFVSQSYGGYSGITLDSSTAYGRMTYPSSSASPGEVKLTYRATNIGSGGLCEVYLSASPEINYSNNQIGSTYRLDFVFTSTGTAFNLYKIGL